MKEDSHRNSVFSQIRYNCFIYYRTSIKLLDVTIYDVRYCNV